MPHCDIQHPETKQWRCYSTIVDDWISNWMDEKDYIEWLQVNDHYYGPLKSSRFYTFEEIAYDIAMKKQYCDQCRFNCDCDNCVYNLNYKAYKAAGHSYLGNFLKRAMEDYPEE